MTVEMKHIRLGLFNCFDCHLHIIIRSRVESLSVPDHIVYHIHCVLDSPLLFTVT